MTSQLHVLGTSLYPTDDQPVLAVLYVTFNGQIFVVYPSVSPAAEAQGRLDFILGHYYSRQEVYVSSVEDTFSCVLKTDLPAPCN